MKFAERSCGSSPLNSSIPYPVASDPRFGGDLGVLGNGMFDREERVEEFFFRIASNAPQCRLVLGGNGWHDKSMPANITDPGHVYTDDHNRFTCSPRTILNINRASMAHYGFSPPHTHFEVADAGAGVITDAWEGIVLSLEPDREAIIVQNGYELANQLRTLTPNACVRNRGCGSPSTPVDTGLSRQPLCCSRAMDCVNGISPAYRDARTVDYVLLG